MSPRKKPAKGVGGQGPSRRAHLAAIRKEQQRKERERKIVVTIAIVVAAALVVGGIVWLVVDSARTKGGDGEQFPITEIAQEPVVGQPIRFAGAADSDGTVPSDIPAGVAHVEVFADFHCPHCVTFEERYGLILREAESKGTAIIDVTMMTIIDQGSVNAANAFACATTDGFGRAYFEALWANATRQWSAPQLVSLAGEIGVQPGEEFAACVNDQAHLDWVGAANSTADARGVKGTPTLFVDGEQIAIGELSPNELRRLVGL